VSSLAGAQATHEQGPGHALSSQTRRAQRAAGTHALKCAPAAREWLCPTLLLSPVGLRKRGAVSFCDGLGEGLCAVPGKRVLAAGSTAASAAPAAAAAAAALSVLPHANDGEGDGDMTRCTHGRPRPRPRLRQQPSPQVQVLPIYSPDR